MTEKQIRKELLAIEKEMETGNISAKVLNDAGVGYFLLGELEQSLQYLKRAVETEESAAHLFNLANTYSELNQPDRAIDTYLQALEKNPAHIGSLNNLADEYEKSGDPDKSHELFHYITHLQPDKAISHFNLGNFFLRQNQHIEASKCYEKVIENDQNFTDAYYNIAWILFKAKAYRESKKFVNDGLQTDSTHKELSELLEDLKGKV